MRWQSIRRLSCTAASVAATLVFATPSSAQDQTASERVKAQHEVDDPQRTTDEYGLAVPVPISHPARRYPAAESEIPSGPDIGTKLPEFQLPNQRGKLIDFHSSRDGAKAVVVFYRSCVW